MISFVEMFPIIVFVAYLKNMDPQSLQNWQALFIASGLAASGVIIFYLYRKWVFNRLLLGLNLYLISGALAFVLKQTWLYQTYETLQASGMLLWIAMTGIVSISTSRRGFIGIDHPDIKSVRIFSFYLLAFSLGSFILSFSFRGDYLLSETLPFVSLFLLQGILKARLLKSTTKIYT